MADVDGRSAVAVGVDGGGTNTRVLLVDAEGQRLGAGTSGSGNLHDVGAERLARHVDEAWRAAWAEAGEAPRAADAVFCGMASVGTEPNRSTVRDVVAGVGVGAIADVHVDIDLVAALAGGLGGRNGVAVIAGTGSSCFGRDASGRTFQSGGWGSLLDDVGSATWLGTRAMVAAIRAYDGRGPATSLQRRVMDRFGLADMRELLPAIDEQGGAERTARAALAPLVTEAAEEGDGVAEALLADGADALAECVEAVWRTLDFGAGPVEVTLTGGLGEGVPAYRDAFHREVERRVPTAVRVLPRTSNLVGAALVALERLPGGLTEQARSRLVEGE
ncbi:MAG: BadF/BadG/BcrA/BcrD ATPase family protein [Planctomycetota bacterium]